VRAADQLAEVCDAHGQAEAEGQSGPCDRVHDGVLKYENGLRIPGRR
jgi:hypothetical protein